MKDKLVSLRNSQPSLRKQKQPQISVLEQAHNILKSFDPRSKRLDQILREGESPIVGGVLGLCESTLRHGKLYDFLIDTFSKMKTQRMERAVIAALRLGLASYFRGVPAYRAVSESVALVRKKNPRAKALVNAVLRRITATTSFEGLNPQEQLLLRRAEKSVLERYFTPVSFVFENRVLVRAKDRIFPDSLFEALELCAGIPQWLGAELRQQLDEQSFALYCLAACEKPATWFRLSQEQEKGEGIATLLKKWGQEENQAEDLSFAYKRVGQALQAGPALASKLIHSKAFQSGAMIVQDYAAQQALVEAAPKKGWHCLDFCAGPGGKLTQLAELIGPKGSVQALESDPSQLKKIKHNLKRLEVSNVRARCLDARRYRAELDSSKQRYDFVLLDAPCSNTGVLARRLELRFRFQQERLKALIKLQQELFESASYCVREGGIFVYSTCSLLASENGSLVRTFLQDKADWKVVKEKTILPLPGEHDGAYFAILERAMSNP